MKKLILILTILSSFAFSQSNNVNVNITKALFYRDTLTATKDTMDIFFSNSDRYSYHTIMIYTTAGTDTVDVYALSLDGLVWTQHAVVDESNSVTTTSIYASTTKKEYILYDTKPQKIRLISNSNDASTTVFLLGIKK